MVQFKGRVEPGRAPAGEGRKPVGCVELAMTHRPASRCVFATHPTCWRPGSVAGPQRPLGHCSPAPRPMPPAGNWLRFACSISPLFVLSHSLPMVNTMGKLALFWRFSITASFNSSISLATGYWLLTTILTPHALTPPEPPTAGTSGVRPCADPPAGYCMQPTAELVKAERDPISTSGPSIQVCHRTRRFLQAKSIRFFPLAAAQPLTILSWPEALKASGSRRACRSALAWMPTRR